MPLADCSSICSKTKWLLALLLVLGAGAAAILAWSRAAPSRLPEDRAAPPVTRTAAYVGVERCAECHLEQAERFAASGHARTFRLGGSAEFAALGGRRHLDEDYGVAFHYAHRGDGLTVALPQVFPGREFPLTYALGSGTHAVTFLTLVPNQHGETVGIEHRVSQFGDGELARTPGATAREPAQPVEHFGEIYEGARLRDCIACHTTTAEVVEFEIHDLRPNVQCERCHGPGSEHVAAMEAGGTATRLAFAPGTATAFAEIQMCGRCHRLPEMLSDTPLERTNAKLPRYQPVGMLQSACYVHSEERLRCTTCHDPHERTGLRPRSQYVETCLRCHQEFHVADCPQAVAAAGGITERAAAGDCIDCHMPPVEVHPGIAFHDHWIRVRDGADPPAAKPAR